MTIYSDLDDIKASIGFTLDTNSRPTETDAIKLQGRAYRKINGHLGEAKTVNDDLKEIETDLVVSKILAIHSKKPFPMILTDDHKIILDDYMDAEELVSSEELYYGFD